MTGIIIENNHHRLEKKVAMKADLFAAQVSDLRGRVQDAVQTVTKNLHTTWQVIASNLQMITSDIADMQDHQGRCAEVTNGRQLNQQEQSTTTDGIKPLL